MTTIPFRKYPSIENSYRQKYMDDLLERGLNKGIWVVTEKVHGSNYQFHAEIPPIGKIDVTSGKRSTYLGDNASFFNHEVVYDKYESKIINLAFALNQADSSVVGLNVYGELCGGHYPHPEVEQDNQATLVQKGVYYHPSNEFVAFGDIMVFFKKMGTVHSKWLKYSDAIQLLETCSIPFVRPLYSGDFDGAISYPNEFQTTIPEYFDLPPIDGNICEGIVIKPNEATYITPHERCILKNKNEKFHENSAAPKKPRDNSMPEHLVPIVEEMSTYMSEARLRNVLSKIGEVGQKDFGRLLGELTQDAFVDIMKDMSEKINPLGKAERKKINKALGMYGANLIRPNFVNIIDGTY